MPDRNRPTHPRPQLRRRHWTALDGQWQFALDPDGRWSAPGAVEWDRTIRVPFAPETAASGVGETGFSKRCWYRLPLTPPDRAPGERLPAHFGPVDSEASV